MIIIIYFLNLKLLVPYAKTRCLDDKLINQEIDKISKDVINYINLFINHHLHFSLFYIVYI